jgi:nucleotide-binding universal stress UspA family protein
MFTKVIAATDHATAIDDAAVLAQLLAGDTGIELAPREIVHGRRPAAALAQLADDQHADALVIGSTHHSTLGRLVLGDPGRDLLHRARCNVAIAPQGYALTDHDRIRTIGVGHDGSDQAEAALSEAAALARERGARLRVLGVAPPAEGQERARRGRLERAVLRSVRRVAPEAEVDVVVSDPRRELDRFSGEVDVLFIGGRRPGAHLRSPLGGVAEHLEQHANGPVVVAPTVMRGKARRRRERPAEGAGATTP